VPVTGLELILALLLHVASAMFAWRIAAQATASTAPVRAALTRAAAGLGAFWLLSATLTTAGLAIGGEQRTDEASLRVTVPEASPAARAGVLEGDRVISARGEPVRDWDALRAIVRRSPDPVDLVVVREDRRIELRVTPEGTPPRIGVGPIASHVRVAPASAAARGITTPAVIGWAFAKSLLRPTTAELAGPVAIVGSAPNATRPSLRPSLAVLGAMGAALFWLAVPLLLGGAAITAGRLARRASRP
jgi:membrane-associated protease RseP (regulator of RpoE activity)